MSARDKIYDTMKALNGSKSNIDMGGWCQDGVPLLQVIAPYPGRPSGEIPKEAVSLNIGRCIERLDKEEVLVEITKSLGIPIWWEDSWSTY